MSPIAEPPYLITIIVRGEYGHPLPAELARALHESIQQHMKAYGLFNIEIDQSLAGTVNSESPSTPIVGKDEE